MLYVLLTGNGQEWSTKFTAIIVTVTMFYMFPGCHEKEWNGTGVCKDETLPNSTCESSKFQVIRYSNDHIEGLCQDCISKGKVCDSVKVVCSWEY